MQLISLQDYILKTVYVFKPGTFRNKNLLQPDKEIVIVTHYNPDGDAIGSSLGLKHALKNLGIDATVVVPNDFPKFLKWMPEAKQVMVSEFKRKKLPRYFTMLT